MSLGERPPGDPGVMLTAAGKLVALAQRAQSAGGRAPRLVPAAAYSGPHRGRLDGRLRDVARHAGLGAQLLLDGARALREAAHDLATAQRDWDRARARELAEERAEEARRLAETRTAA